jgi:hypothetical protein
MSGVPFSADAAKVFDGLAKGLDGAGQVAAGKKPPGRLAVRQTVPVVPALGSPESFAQAASILGGIASGLKGQSSIPFAADAASALDGLAKGLGNAGQAAKKSPGRMALRQIAAAGSPESKAQAAAILTGLAQGLKGTSIPYGNDASAALTSIAKGLSGSA